jgi:endoglycosylceramidase
MFWSYNHYVVAHRPDEVLEPADAAHVNAAMLKTLARPYPQLIAGTPSSWDFDTETGAFSFTWSTARADGRGAFGPKAQTSIAVPPVAYPGGYVATVTGGRVVSQSNAPVLRVRPNAGADHVTVTITPAD